MFDVACSGVSSAAAWTATFLAFVLHQLAVNSATPSAVPANWFAVQDTAITRLALLAYNDSSTPNMPSRS